MRLFVRLALSGHQPGLAAACGGAGATIGAGGLLWQPQRRRGGWSWGGCGLRARSSRPDSTGQCCARVSTLPTGLLPYQATAKGAGADAPRTERGSFPVTNSRAWSFLACPGSRRVRPRPTRILVSCHPRRGRIRPRAPKLGSSDSRAAPCNGDSLARTCGGTASDEILDACLRVFVLGPSAAEWGGQTFPNWAYEAESATNSGLAGGTFSSSCT
mmetsp:Transcript_26981/g.85537  ORF Transcript_26981/g.85537 Transcript_26981/m.85537 type:complete len:215 (-) Transcript_26981:2067-2711(-)